MDDAIFNVFSLQQILETFFGLRADFAYSGEEALAKVLRRKSNFRLIFMDLNMPGLNGVETTMRLKEMHARREVDLSETKFVLFSCLANTNDLP